MPRPLPISRSLLSLLFVFAGLMHFRTPQTYVKIMPPYLPYPLELVYLSGAAEIAGGVGVWPRSTRHLAGWGLIALLVAVFPANIDMALRGTSQTLALETPRWLLWARLPLQPLLIFWFWSATRREVP